MSVMPVQDSLAWRLSRRLAIQSFLGLALLSLADWAMTATHVRDRQSIDLAELGGLVEHRLSEIASGSSALGQNSHNLLDLISHRGDVVLKLKAGELESRVAAPGVVFDEHTRSVRRHEVIMSSPGDASASHLSATVLLDTTQDRALLVHLAFTLLVTSLAGALLASVVAAWHVRRGLAPIRRLGDAVAALRSDTLDRPLDYTDQPAELRPLIGRFNELLVRVDQVYRQMRAFNANVAHELKTPLATLSSEAELLLGDRTLGLAAQDRVGSMLEEVQRMDRIVRAMLLLSSAEQGAAPHDMTMIQGASVANAVIDYHEAALEDAGLSVTVNGDATFEGSTMLLRQALSNLLGNATRHARHGTSITIEIKVIPDRSVSFVVTNRGSTVPVEQLGRLFERFYRVADASVDARDTRVDRHGLGLAIVAAVARMHGGDVSAASSAGVTRIGFTVASRQQQAAESGQLH